MHQTVHEAFAEACDQRPDHPFIVVPAAPERPYLPRGETFSYRQVQQQVRALEDAYSAAGFGLGHRVALLLENRPAHFLHLLALNALGASIVPINPDYRADEIGYLLEHSGADLVVALEPRVPSLREIAAHSTKSPAVVPAESLPGPLPSARSRANAGRPDRSTEAALLYTSGTTARPKGCVLSNDYHFAVGETYLNYGGLATLRAGAERAYNPLPLFHMNAGIFSFMGMLLSGGCVIVPDRFHPSRFWSELAQTGATIVHYLGVIPPILLKRAPAPEDRAHRVRFGVGAGIEPELHDAFEHRFGFPLLELWGMTETGGGFMAATEPRETHTRAFGRPDRDMLARVIDEQGQEV